MTFRGKRILITTALILGLSIQAPAASGDDRTNESYESYHRISKIPERLINRRPKQFDNSLAITPVALLHKLKQKQKIALIDVRNQEDFARLQLPGSINLPLHVVKTKFVLKSFFVVLINEGFNYNPLENECSHLRNRGFKTFILDGGLAAWQRQGNRLVGDLFALEEMQVVSPQILFQEKDYENTLVINISPIQTKVSKQLLPYSMHLPVSDEPGNWAQKFGRTIASHKNQPFLSILIVSQTGDGYDKVNNILADQDLNAFYLQGGVVAYRKYIEDLMLSWRPRQNRIKTNRQCGTCVKEVQKDTITEVRK